MYLSKFVGEFEGRALEAEVVPGRVGQDKAKVNVNDVAFRVHQNVPIVSAARRYFSSDNTGIPFHHNLHNTSQTNLKKIVCAGIRTLDLLCGMQNTRQLSSGGQGAKYGFYRNNCIP